MLSSLLATFPASGQDAAPPPAAADPPAAAPVPPTPPAPLPKCTSGVIPALTPVSLQILDELGSKISRTGQSFTIRLTEPIAIDGCEAVPTGATGRGEVVHAKKNGGSGTPGELVLAARYLDVGDRQLRLRSMHLSVVGKDNYGAAFAVGVTIGLPALFMSGKNALVPPGSAAIAKTAEPFDLSPVPSGPPQDEAQPAPAATTQSSPTTVNPTGGNSNEP